MTAVSTYPAKWPQWLVDVAVSVDELIGQPKALARFQSQLREWKAEHDRQGPKGTHDRHGALLYNEVQILPRRRLTSAGKYAVLAAIHDLISDKSKRIDLWATHKRLRAVGKSKAKAGIAYAVLQGQVMKLRTVDQPRIEAALRDVETDLVSSLATSAPTPLEFVLSAVAPPAPRAPASAKPPHKKRNKSVRKRSKRTVPTERELLAMQLKSREYSLAQIGHEMSISKERARQLLKAGHNRRSPPGRSIDLSKAQALPSDYSDDKLPAKRTRRQRRPAPIAAAND